MAVIKSGNSTDQLSIDATSKAARVTLYDTDGNPVSGINNGFVSTLNSHSTPLTSNETWIGTYEDISEYSAIQVIGVTDQIGTLYFDFSTDGSNLDRSVQLSSGTDSSLGIHGLVPVTKYGRVRLVNGSTAQTYLRLQMLSTVNAKVSIPTSRLSQTLNSYSDVINTRSLSASTFDYTTGALAGGATYTSQTFDTLVNGYGFVVTIKSATDGTHWYDESNDGTNWTELCGAPVIAGVDFEDNHVAASRYVRIRFVNGTSANAGGISNFSHAIAQRATNTPQQTEISRVSELNSYSGSMASNGTFQGLSENAEGYTTASISFFTPYGTSLNGTLWIQVSRNNVDWSNIPRDIRGTDTSQPIMFLIAERYFKIYFENGKDSTGASITTTSSSNFQVQTMFASGRAMDLGQQMGDTIADNFGGILSKSVLTGRTQSSKYVNIEATTRGALKTSIQEPLTAFGEVSTAVDTPTAQIDFVYGINTDNTITTTTGSGTASASNSLLVLSTTAATSSSAQLVSRRFLKYRPGQGAKARITALFTTGVANSKQYAGAFNSAFSDGFGFGYNGTTFGIWHINNGSETHIPQSTWNVDRCDGSNSTNNKSGINLDTNDGNIYQIKYQYLGFGNIRFSIEDPNTGVPTLVHMIKYANANTSTSLANPTLNLAWRTVNTTNNTNIVVKAGSGYLAIEGTRLLLGSPYSTSNNKSITSGTTTSLFAIRNATTYNGVTNRAIIRLSSISFSTGNVANNAFGTLQLTKSATLGGSPSYTPDNGSTADNGVTITSGQSPASVDVAGTTVTGGTKVWQLTGALNTNSFLDLTALDIFIAPGETLVFAGSVSANGSLSATANYIIDL